MDRTWTADLTWILLAAALVALNGFFVAAEFALIKVRPARLAERVREGRPFAAQALWLSERMDRSLSACQLGITMASLGLGWVGEPAIAHLLEPVFRSLGIETASVIHGASFAVAFTVITAAHLVLGEQVPKIYALRRPELLAIWCAVPLKVFYVLSYPLLRMLDAATSTILAAVGVGQTSEHGAPHSEEELRVLLGQSRSHGELSQWEHRLVDAAFESDDTVCRQVMVPRTEVVALDLKAPLEESLQLARRTMHTRYPVCDGSLDSVVGVLHVKDLVGLKALDEDELRSLLRPPKYVPETMPVSAVLGHFQSTRQHMALVVDEHGTLVGIVTLENVVEQIVGPVLDEFDEEQPDFVPEGGGRALVRGGMPVRDLVELMNTEVDTGQVDTAAGLVMDRLGRVPRQGDRVEFDGVTLEVVEVRNHHATRIRLLRQSSDSD